jgi:hypothetical protein
MTHVALSARALADPGGHAEPVDEPLAHGLHRHGADGICGRRVRLCDKKLISPRKADCLLESPSYVRLGGRAWLAK